ncbi:MAG: NUDIX domain-containing protein [Clostridia bacterium]|nr:NUDIX domain-containing protein [Clostridia bacterium]
MEVRFHDIVEDSLLKFAVIIAMMDGKYIFCKHRERKTLEIPGGHREENEAIDDTAKRELYEETGAISYSIKPLFSYEVISNGASSYGRLYFANVKSLEEELKSEMELITLFDELPPLEVWTYPVIQFELIKEAKRRNFI